MSHESDLIFFFLLDDTQTDKRVLLLAVFFSTSQKGSFAVTRWVALSVSHHLKEERGRGLKPLSLCLFSSAVVTNTHSLIEGKTR